jgi:hypothetical protein
MSKSAFSSVLRTNSGTGITSALASKDPSHEFARIPTYSGHRKVIAELPTQLERDVVAILQDEVGRYINEGGRSEGRLGSVRTNNKTSGSAGIPGDGWSLGTNSHHLIDSDGSTGTSISSKNAEALVRLYQRLPTDDARAEFDVALFKRLNRESEYRRVSYIGLIAMKNLGRLPVFLRHVELQLAGCEGGGFDDVVRALGVQLRFEHASLSDEELDACELFAVKTKPSSSFIREKVSAIRALRARR